jgi:hypothetical protein
MRSWVNAAERRGSEDSMVADKDAAGLAADETSRILAMYVASDSCGGSPWVPDPGTAR